jgi:hypothetical protein
MWFRKVKRSLFNFSARLISRAEKHLATKTRRFRGKQFFETRKGLNQHFDPKGSNNFLRAHPSLREDNKKHIFQKTLDQVF